MRQYNLIVIEGRLTKDPDFSYTQNNNPILKFSIANHLPGVSKNGEKTEDVSYFDITAWGVTADIYNKYLKKGSRIIVTGKAKQYRWEKDGKKHSKIKILADKIDFVSTGYKKKKAFVVK